MTDKSWAYALKYKYGITPEQYDELMGKQEGRCPICERHAEEFPRRLAVDHNHKTGEVRGLLCAHCNHRIVGKHTDADKMDRVAKYLRNTTGWTVPQRKKRVKRRKVKNESET